MNFNQLFEALASRSLRVKLRPDRQLEVVGDTSTLTDDMKTALRESRQLFLNLLSPEDTSETPETVKLGTEVFPFAKWRTSETLRSPIAIDTETRLIEDRNVPQIALASVSDGRLHRLIHPKDLDSFIDRHKDAHFVCHNASFDFEVILASLRDPLPWVEVADTGRLHDTMILDSLIRLGKDDSYPKSRDLGTLARNYLGVVIDKDDPFRLRYAELIDRPWDLADPGFFTYAIKDAIVTRKLWDVLSAIASKLLFPYRDSLLPDAWDRFGPLTESLQVRGAIALRQIERNGISLDRGRVVDTKSKLTSEIEVLTTKLQQLPESGGLFKRNKLGELSLTASGKPAMNRLRLCEILTEIAEELELTDTPTTGKTGKIGSSVKYWGQYAERSSFLSLWIQLEEVSKLCQFFAGLASEKIHPRYTTLVRTGRTSCHGPNIQQLPRSGGFREMVVPSRGFLFLQIDYSAIELRTLAAVCEDRYGSSRLASVIREGVDPHAFTASMFAGVSPEDFNSLPNRKQLRQQAKALNFGIPGGLGAKSLVTYAATTYGVELSLDEATVFRDRLIREVYPELGEYLKEDPIALLAGNLRTSPFRVRSLFDSDSLVGALKRIVSGKGKASGAEYGDAFVDRLWNSLEALNCNRTLAEAISNREAGDNLFRSLFFGPVITSTGRLRGRVGFSQSRNTPFQGIAADGAKLALWNLYKAGFRTVAFIHDEALIEIPEDANHTEEAKRVEEILCRSMEEFTGSIPIACEYSLADRWYKAAEAVFDESGKLKTWTPKK